MRPRARPKACSASMVTSDRQNDDANGTSELTEELIVQTAGRARGVPWSKIMRSTFLLGAAGALLAATALAQTLTTAEFVKKVALSDMLEIQASELIAPHADADTKPFAEMMVKDHKGTSSELKELVQSRKISAELPSALDAEHQKKLDDL